MQPIAAARPAAKLGSLLAGLAVAGVAARWPTFFGGSGAALATFAAFAAAPAALAGLAGCLLRPRLAAALGGALAGAAFLAGAAVLLLPTVTPARIAAGALAGVLGGAFLGSRRWLERKPATWLALLAPVVVVASALVRQPAPAAPPADRPKIFVYGLDAGTWTILDELIAAGRLPHLQSLQAQGTTGTLVSEVESASPRVWTTIATGKSPAQHGVVDFFCTQNEHLKTLRIWEILQSQGWSVGLFQWLVTWPPDPFDPFVVPAWMARGPETWPASLAFVKELELAFQTGEFEQWKERGEWATLLTRLRDWGVRYLDHGLTLATARTAARHALVAVADPSWEKQYAAKRTLQLLLNGDVFVELWRRHAPDFSSFICYGTDNLAHKLWQYHYPDDFGIPHAQAAPFAELLTDYYVAADALLGRILAGLPRDTTVAVLSDHGFTSHGEGGESQQRELRPKMSRIAALLGLGEEDVLSSSVATRGYFRPAAGERGAAAGRKILDFLAACEAIGGAPVFRPAVDAATGQIEVAVNLDARFEHDTAVATPLRPMRFDDLVDIEERTGNHSVDGIVLLRGPAIRRGARLDVTRSPRLADVAPTLLHLHGFAVGADMSGRVIEEALTESFRADHQVEVIASWDEEIALPTRTLDVAGDADAMLKYLQQQGYVDSGDPPPRAPGGDGG